MNSTNLFGLDINQLRSLVAEGMRGGGDWCDLYFEDTSYHDLLLHDGEVSSGGFHVDYGCGIRVLKGDKTGYAYSETTDYAALLSAARAAGAIAEATLSSPETGRYAAAPKGARNFYPMAKDWRECEAKSFVPFLENIEKGIRSRDQRVVKVIAMLSYSVSEVLMYNSLDELTSDIRPLGSLTVQTVFSQNGKIETSSVSRSLRVGSELISDDVLEDLVSRAVKGVDERFEAKRPKGGRMPVVMGAGASGILLHEAMGHAFEADFNRKGQSVFSDKMGKAVCRKGIDIVDDGTLTASRGACNYDDEGVPGQKTYMVKDGILNSYLHDRISAKHYGVAPTGNGRRESFRYNPIPRMRATYMENGADGTLQDLIGSVKRGIFVDQFSNGEVKIGEGDFTFYVKSGWLIEKGRLTMPVKDINIIGNGPQALADIEAVANDLKIDEGTWTCGKEQSVAVSCGIPSVLIKNLTVGGE
ncbi:MAG: TldD/PmbA family protein [Bacteroidales bacterium]|nr:TldD/PmbA family protein [Bacteroidales bacterium]